MNINIRGSIGEQMIESVLRLNNINYKREYTFTNLVGTVQRMDFFVDYEGKKYCLEFHGEQHYKDKAIFSGGIEIQKERDNNKKKYCNENRIEYIEIPYTVNTISKIHRELTKYFGDLVEPDNFIIHRGVDIDTKELLEFYKNHTIKETAERFGIADYKVGNILTSLEYENKRVKKDLIEIKNKKTQETFVGTYHEIKSNFKVTMSNVHKCLNGSMDSTGGYTFRYIDESKDKVRLKAIEERKKLNKEKLKNSKYKKTPVTVLDIFTGEEENYKSIKEAEEKLGIKGISVYLYGKRKRVSLQGKMFKTDEIDYNYTIEEARKRTTIKTTNNP